MNKTMISVFYSWKITRKGRNIRILVQGKMIAPLYTDRTVVGHWIPTLKSTKSLPTTVNVDFLNHHPPPPRNVNFKLKYLCNRALSCCRIFCDVEESVATKTKQII